jgi:hypothetical protein
MLHVSLVTLSDVLNITNPSWHKALRAPVQMKVNHTREWVGRIEFEVLRLESSAFAYAIAATADKRVCRDFLNIMLHHELMALPWIELDW